jgi:hypothetical protein
MNSPAPKESITNNLPTTNTGLIEGSGTKGLWAAGKIPFEERNPSGDWRPYLVTEEHQYSHNVDSMACVSFSCDNDLEIQNKFLTAQEVNFSDRFLAKMSGTTHQGNYLDKVADTVRTIGLVTEDVWPANDDYTWDSYYSDIPQDVINQVIRPDIAFEGIPPDQGSLLHHLKQSPIQITIPLPYPNHAVVLVAMDGQDCYYFDTYSPYLKTINVSKISYALKIVLNQGVLMNQTKVVLGKDGKTVYLATPVSKMDVLTERSSIEGFVIPNQIPKAADVL